MTTMKSSNSTETAKILRPEDREKYTEEIEKALAYMAGIKASEVRCMAICIIESSPEATDKDRVKATHMVIGSKPQMAAMLASTYSAIGRSFDGENEAKDVKKENLQ